MRPTSLPGRTFHTFVMHHTPLDMLMFGGIPVTNNRSVPRGTKETKCPLAHLKAKYYETEIERNIRPDEWLA